MALPVTITGISTAVACVGPYKTTNSPIVVTTLNAASAIQFGISSLMKAGQTWTHDAAASPVTAISFYLEKNGTPTDDLAVDIFATSGGLPTGSSLGTSNVINGSAIGATGGGSIQKFTFSSPVSLSASTQYAAVLSRSGAADASNNYRTLGTASSVYSGGTSIFDDGAGNFSTGTTDRILIVGAIDAFYFFGRDSATTTKLQAYKATDPTSSWGTIANNTTFTDVIGAIAGYPVSDVIHIIANDGATAGQVLFRYKTFDMSSDSFSVNETIASGLTTAGQTGAQQTGCSIVVRSNGNAVAFFNGAQTKKSGTNYARVYWSERTGASTWSAAAEVDDAGATDNTVPEAVLGVSDSVHLIWGNSSATAEFQQRTLNSSNVLQTAGTANVAAMQSTMQAVSYDRSGTTKVVVGYTPAAAGAVYFDSGNTPTLNLSTITAAAVFARTFNDNTDVWALYVLNADTDLYVKKSTDDGANWGTATNAMTATVTADNSLSRDGNIYQRGNDFVIPYVVNDNGTLKYNEYVVRTLVSDTLFAQSVM